MKNINSAAPDKVTKEHIDRAVEYYELHKDDNPPPKAKEIIQYASGSEVEIDARCKFGKELLEQISTFGIFPNRSHQYAPKKKVKLTTEQEEFIQNNACRMKWYDCAKQLFPKIKDLNPASFESRAVKSFYDSLPENLKIDIAEESDKKYSPPKTLERAIVRVNKYILEGINKEKITNSQKANMGALIKYLNGYRFLSQINSYIKSDDRDAFEDCFIRYTFDKPDLTQEEIDQYIILSSEVVIARNTKDIVEMLQQQLREANDPSNDDSEGDKAMTMKLIEAIKNSQSEYNQCIGRQNALIKTLKGDRAARIKNKLETNKSFAHVIDAWKVEETRIKMLKFAEMRRSRMKESIDHYQSMDDMTAEIFGLTEEEVLDG